MSKFDLFPIGAITLGVGQLLLTPAASPALRLAMLAGAITFFLLSLRHHANLAKWPIVGAVVLGVTIAIAVEPRDSHDVWSYAAYGHLVADHHVSPYTHAPQDFPGPVTEQVATGWVHVSSVYGPLFTAISAVGAWISGDSLIANRLFHQGIAALVMALCLARARSTKAIVFLGCNPAVLFMVNGGHNDFLMGGLLAWGCLTAARHPRRAGLLFAMAILVKASAVIGVVAGLAWMLGRHRRSTILQTAAITGATTVIAYLLAGGWNAVRPLIEGGSGAASRASIWSGPRALLSNVLDSPDAAATIIGALSLAILVTVAVRYAPRTTLIECVAWTMAVGILLSPSVLPWYCGWVLPIAMFASGDDKRASRASRAALVVSLALAIAYVIPPGVPTGTVFGVISLCALPTAALFVARFSVNSLNTRAVAL